MMPRRAGRGFTLLEVILAVTLVIGLMGGLLAFYSYATDLRGRVGEQARQLAARRLVMDRITGELRAANSCRFLRIGLVGGQNEVHFVTASLPGPSVWVEPKAGEQPIPPEHDLRLVGYRLRTATDDDGRPARDEEGNVIVYGLERTVQKLLTAPKAEEGRSFQEVREIHASLLSPQFKFLNFRYWTGDTWVASWAGGDLPVAVEITLGAAPLPEGMEIEDYVESHQTFRRVVYLPAAARPGTGAVIHRGAAGSGRGGAGR